MTQTIRILQLDGQMPQVIVAGIGYPEKHPGDNLRPRIYDLTPTSVPKADQEWSLRLFGRVRSGGAADFLRVIEKEIVPLVDASYRTTNDRGLAGFSLGGLFATYVLLNSPASFNRYVIGSPSLHWDGGLIFRQEARYASERKELRARVFLSVAAGEDNAEMIAPVRRMADALRKYAGLQLQSQVFENENHLSVIPATFSRGLRVVYASR